MNERRIDLTGCATSAKRGLELRWRLAGEERRSRKEEQGDGGFACRPRDPLQTQLLGTWERPDSESDRAIELKLTTRLLSTLHMPLPSQPDSDERSAFFR